MTILFLKADIALRYRRMLARRTDGTPEAMAREDARITAALERYVPSHEPTQAQLDAGNYAKKRIRFQGIEIAVETPSGTVRRGRDADGHEWEKRIHADYGYFVGTLGVDGDAVDCFVGMNPDAPMAYVVRTMKRGDWQVEDESKVFIGFNSLEDARRVFDLAYDDPRFFGGITAFPVSQLRAKLAACRGKFLKSLPVLFIRRL